MDLSETLTRINPEIVRVIRVARAFHCRSVSEAALLFKLRCWERYSETDPYRIKEIGRDIVFVTERHHCEWSAIEKKCLSVAGVDVVDVRALICSPPRVGTYRDEIQHIKTPTVLRPQRAVLH